MAPKPQNQFKPAHLKTDGDLAAAIAALGEQCRIMRAIAKRCGQPPLREFPADFAGLAKIVTGQQVSAASAAAIWGRVESGIRPFEAPHLLQCTDSELKSLGLSSGKCRTLRAVAEAVAAGTLNFSRLNRTSDDAIRAELTALHGIGPWTADIYLLFAGNPPCH
jgi:DNA-3-methyladenine glycosylase II